MKDDKRRPTAVPVVDDADDIEDTDDEETVPVAPVVSEQSNLPPGYAFKEFFKINGPAVRFRHRSSSGVNTPSRKYSHGDLVAKEIAPSAMIEAADNPAKTFIDTVDGKLKFYVETVKRIVRVNEETNKTGVIHVEEGEIPFNPPAGPNIHHVNYQPLRPEQVIVRGLQAKVDAKRAAEAGAAKK